MFGFGINEIIVLIAILLLIFAPKKLSEVASGIGDAIRQIRGVVAEKEGTSAPVAKDERPTKAAKDVESADTAE